jgi:hypothetical protein
VCRLAPGVFHLLFADDQLWFFRASIDEATGVKAIIDNYANGTGQLVNPAKCSVIFSGSCLQGVRNEVRNVLHVVNQEFEEKYLEVADPGWSYA